MAPHSLVLRFSGSSLDNPLWMRNAGDRIREHRLAGVGVAVVVGPSPYRTSRMFGWLERLRESRHSGVAREVDRGLAAAERVTASLLAATIVRAGIGATSFGVDEAGLSGDGDFGEGILQSLDASRIGKVLAQGAVVVLAGGCVRRSDGEVISLGPLGADVTAVALAEALGADCHFVVDRRRLDLARENEPLIHPEALRRARDRNVVIETYSFRRGSRESGRSRGGGNGGGKPG